ncbi:MAG: hypothetical protein KDK23_05760 [Leptospiraceae bacterium]|nr:hypothetical protein [Leptospiraceae bacterium]
MKTKTCKLPAIGSKMAARSASNGWSQVFSHAMSLRGLQVRLPGALALFLAGLLAGCTNYSSDPYAPSTPILLGLSPDGSTSSNINAISTYGNGHSIRVAAQNYEPGFQGYRLFQGASEDAVRNADASTGISCSTLLQTPVLGVVYTVEARTDGSVSESTALCVFPIVLTSGNFVAIRSVYYRGLLDPESTGPSSNALQVP